MEGTEKIDRFAPRQKFFLEILTCGRLIFLQNQKLVSFNYDTHSNFVTLAFLPA